MPTCLRLIDSLRWEEAPERCNWKVTVENYNECYHCRKNHKTFVKGVVDPNTYNILPQGYCLRHTSRSINRERMTYAIDLDANEHATDYSSWFLWPTFSFQVYPGNILNTYHWQVQEIDNTLAIRGWYTMDSAACPITETLADQDRDTTVAEDVCLVESVQRGLNSIGYRPGPLILDTDLGVNSKHSIKVLYDWREQLMERS